MARKIRGFERVLDVPSLAAVAFGEIASSVYFALGVVALFALGFTPWVLLLVGAVFGLVALSYAEGTAALPQAGGGALFVARAFNDLAGFLVGWVLFLDYLIVVALAVLFVPHYVGTAVGWDGITREPWDGVVAVGVLAVLVAARLFRRTSMYTVAMIVAAIAFVTLMVLSGLAIGFLFEPGDLTEGLDLGTAPTWASLAFALAARDARLHRARDGRQPGRRGARAGPHAPAQPLRGDRGRRRRDRDPRDRRARRLSGRAGRPDRARNRVDPRAASSGSRPRCPTRSPGRAKVIAGLSGALVLFAAVVDLDVGRRPARVLARAPRHAPAPVRPAEPPDAPAARRDRRRRPHDRRTARDRRGNGRARPLPGRASTASGSSSRSRPRSSPSSACGAPSRSSSAPSARPGNVMLRGVAVPLPALIGAPLTAALSSPRSRRTAARRSPGPSGSCSASVLFVAVRMFRRERVLARITPAVGRPRAGGGGRVQPHPRAGQARGHRRGGARHGGEARGRARRADLRAPRRARPARAAARAERRARAGGAARRRSRRRASSPRSTASRSTSGSSAPARSARRSSRRPSGRAPT